MEERMKNAVRTVFSRLDGSDILWCLAGSVNMQLQGINVEPNDLDVVIQYKDLERASLLFSDYSATPVRKMEKTFSGQLVWEVVAYINNIKVQFFGRDKDDIYSSKMMAGMTTKVLTDDMKIPCLTLEAEMKCYIETKREHKAKIIKDFISERSKE